MVPGPAIVKVAGVLDDAVTFENFLQSTSTVTSSAFFRTATYLTPLSNACCVIATFGSSHRANTGKTDVGKNSVARKTNRKNAGKRDAGKKIPGKENPGLENDSEGVDKQIQLQDPARILKCSLLLNNNYKLVFVGLLFGAFGANLSHCCSFGSY